MQILPLRTSLLMGVLGAIPAFAEAPNLEHRGDQGAHQAHQREFGQAIDLPPTRPARSTLPTPTPGPDRTVYGYLAYWDNDLTTVPWDQLSHLAIFSAGATSSGDLTVTDRWSQTADAVAMGAPYGVRVHLCVTNFDTGSLETLLGSQAARDHLISQLETWVQTTGAHGVNIDFEGMPASRRQQMVDFIADLEQAVGEVVVATPPVDWSGAWDFGALSEHSDLFIMGYNYHYAGSGNAGPTDPLYSGSGTPWPGQHSLSWTVADHLAKGADPQRVILGLPLYGYRFPVQNNQVPTANTGSGTSVFMDEEMVNAATYGSNYEEGSLSRWYYTGTHQVWYPDVDTVLDRIQYAIDAEIGGFGFWALNYDGAHAPLWEAIGELTAVDEEPDPGGEEQPPPSADFTADAGPPFLAYVSDTIILSGVGSSGPAEVDLQYRWEQVSGPPVRLSAADVMEPSFVVEAPGTHTFALVVGDGERWSAPAQSYVVVLDPDAGRRHNPKSCGCATASSPATLGLLLLPLLIGLRRR